MLIPMGAELNRTDQPALLVSSRDGKNSRLLRAYYRPVDLQETEGT